MAVGERGDFRILSGIGSVLMGGILHGKSEELAAFIKFQKMRQRTVKKHWFSGNFFKMISGQNSF